MFTLIASMLSTPTDSVRKPTVFNNADTKPEAPAHFLPDTDAVDNSSRLYTDWLFGEISIPARRASANCQCSCN